MNHLIKKTISLPCSSLTKYQCFNDSTKIVCDELITVNINVFLFIALVKCNISENYTDMTRLKLQAYE